MLNVRFLLCTFGRSMSTSPGSTVSDDTVYAETHFSSRRMRLSVTLSFCTESLECAKPYAESQPSVPSVRFRLFSVRLQALFLGVRSTRIHTFGSAVPLDS